MTDTFYMMYNRKYPDHTIPFIENNDVPILTNAKNRWSTAYEDFLPMWKYDTEHVVDAGGFSILQTHGEYPWSVREYHRWLQDHAEEIEWATVMDFACEEVLSDIGTVEERMDMTIENTVEHARFSKRYQMLPVLQGITADQYVESYERLEDRGVDVSHVGLGSVCRRSSSTEIREIVTEVRRRCDIDRLHGFGAKLNAIRMGVNFDSMDSAAWSEYPQNGKVFRPNIVDGEYVGGEKVDLGDGEPAKSACMSFETYYAQATYRIFGEPAVDPQEIIDRWE